MAIRIDAERVDDQGFPVVTWEEDRNLFSPGGYGLARVACFIKPNKWGVLQFVCVGSVRYGKFVDARPWDKLKGFERAAADQLYHSSSDRAAMEWIGSRSKSGAARVLMADGAYVLLANFGDSQPGVPMHLNCADCAFVDIVQLHDRLHREFITNQEDLIEKICGGVPVWPPTKPAFVTFEPNISPRVRNWKSLAADLLVFAIVAGLAAAFFYFVIKY